MKPKLNKKDQAEQSKIRKKLFAGQSLASLFGGAEDKSGSDKNKKHATASNGNGAFEKTIEPHLIGNPLPPWHIVQDGDTLKSIAASYGVTIRSLKKLNKLSDEQASELKAGQKIRIQ